MKIFRKKKRKKGFTLVELLAVIVILAVIILIAVMAVLPQMQKARRKAFADEGLVFAKAAENAYIDDQASGDKAYTIEYLRKHYVTKADDDYNGCVIVNVDNSGRIQGKTIYLAQKNKFMILGETDINLEKNLDKKVKDYKESNSNGWKNNYSSCNFGQAPILISSSTEVTIETTGLYSLEVWGAQGGDCFYRNNNDDNEFIDPRNAPDKYQHWSGGYGGYAYGEIALQEGDKLYVEIGTSPRGGGETHTVNGNIVKSCETSAGYNGGAAGSDAYIAGGGGATTIASVSGQIGDPIALENIYIVAGGGGGAKVTNHNGYSGGGAKDETGQVSQSGQYNSNIFGKAGGVGNGGGFYGSSSNNSNYMGGRGGSGYIGNPKIQNGVMYGYNVANNTNTSMKTITTTSASSVPEAGKAKEGNGYAKITYLGEVEVNND